MFANLRLFRKSPFYYILKKLYANDSDRDLDKSQRNVFANFLYEYRDIFSEKVVARNCDIVTHSLLI